MFIRNSTDHGVYLFYVFDKYMFEVDALINANTLMETKNRNANIKIQQYEQRI